MKKFIYCATALVAALFAASCQREMHEPVAEGGVTYTITLPETVQTRGESGYAEYDLYYEVYKTIDAAELKTAQILFEKKVEMTGNTTTLTLDLLNDQDYTILFWANKKDESYFNVADLRNVEMVQAASNNNDRDAFCGVDQIAQHDGAKSKTVTLTRPFAQLNIATIVSTTAGYDLTPINSYVKVSKIPVAYNVAIASPVGEDAVVEYTKNTVPAGKKVNDKYDLVAMNYVLVPEGNIEVYYEIETVNGTVKNTVNNVPLKKNYRTNIIGNLLTSNADYTVEIKPGFDTPDEVVDLWDGKTLTAPDFDPATSTWTIDNGAELSWLANAVNETLPSTRAGEPETETTPVYKSGDNVVLGADINLGDREWTPIGVDDKRFKGTFDGKGHIISNFKITTHHGGAEQAALFGNLAGTVVIKNLTIENADVRYPGKDDFYGAALVATAYGNVTIENVTVRDSYISGNNKVAGILAHDGVVSSLNINNCHVLNCKIESLNAEDGGNVGGLVGLLQAGIEHSINNSSVKNTVINGINSSNTGKRANGEFVACVSGKNELTLKIENCEVKENTFTQNEGVTYVSPYGVFVGGRRSDDGMPTIIVDNKEMIQDGLTKEENTFTVATAESLQAALEKVSDGDIIKLEKDIVFETGANGSTNGISYTGAASFTLDLNGKTVTSNLGNNALRFKIGDGNEIKDKQVTITIKNGSVVSAGDANWCAISAATADNSGNKLILNLEDLEVSNSKAGDYAVKSWAGAVINAKDVEVTSSYGGGFYAVGGEVTLDNCTAAQTGMHTEPFLSMSLAVSGNGKMTVTSGTYSSVPVAEADGDGQGTSHGCWVAGVMNSGGTLIINGGTFANGNYGEDALATAPRGAILADTGANIQINGGTFNALKAIVDVTNNLGDASRNPSVTLTGGEFSADPRVSGLYGNDLISVAEGYVVAAPETEGGYYTIKEYRPAAKVGNTEYGSIDEAIAAWTNNTTLTLLANVTLNDVIKISSTEMHTLDLGTYTLTGAKGKNAIEIVNNGRSSASYALDIKADATNPGGITASSAVVKTTGKSGVKDRPIIRFYNGVFNANNIINHGGSNGTNSPQFIFYNGVYNGNINTNRAICIFEGGTFNGRFFMSVDSSSYARIGGGKFKYMDNLYGSTLNADKFTIGSAKGVFDRGVYVDDEGYIVVGGSVITEFGDKFAAKATNASQAGSYLPYSSAAEHGLYYTNAEMAIAKHGEANVVLK